MYKTFVISALIWDSLQVLVFPLFAALLYFAGLHREKPRGRVLLTLGLVFGFFTAIEVYDKFPYLYDYARYLRAGDAYVREAVCQINDTASGTVVGVMEAHVRWYCADGSKFVSRYRRDLQPLAWRWAQARQTLRIRYLPRSHLVLEATPIQVQR